MFAQKTYQNTNLNLYLIIKSRMNKQKKSTPLYYSPFSNTYHVEKIDYDNFEGKHAQELPFKNPPQERLKSHQKVIESNDSWDTIGKYEVQR